MFGVCAVLCWPQGLEEVGRTDIGKKIKEGVEEATRTAMHSAESVSKGGEKLGRISAFRAISQVRGGIRSTQLVMEQLIGFH